MTDETIVAIYDTHAHAELAAADLLQAGVPKSAIDVHAKSVPTAGTTSLPREEGFWSSLFGGTPDHDTAVYDRSMDNGSTVVTVKAPETHITRVMEILESHKPVDIDERAGSYGMAAAPAVLPQPIAAPAVTAPVGAGSPRPASNDTADTGGVMQLAEESLTVGKRVVNRGGTRIRRFVVETPVEESVNLHSERVILERHPVTGSKLATDSFSDKTIEMTEMAEEAVVSKTAHVYEEVGLRKEATDRVETVRDTIRKEEVDIEQLSGATTPAKTTAPSDTNTPKI